MSDVTDELAERLHALGAQVAGPPPDLDYIELRVARRRRRRRVGRATGAVAAVLAVAALGVGLGGRGAPEGAEEVAQAAGPGGTGFEARHLISQGDTAVWYGDDGSVAATATPVPGSPIRVEPVGDGTAVAITVDGPGPQQIVRLTPGAADEMVAGPAEGDFSTLWAAGVVGGRPVVIGSPMALQSRLVALDLDGGGQRTLIDAGATGLIDTVTMTDDGRALVAWRSNDVDCRTVVVDVATGAQTPTGLGECAITRAISPDGTTAASVDLAGHAVVVEDVATGAEVARVGIDEELVGRALRLDFDGRHVALGDTGVSDEQFVPGQVIDVETGTSAPLPGDGPATIWGDVGG